MSSGNVSLIKFPFPLGKARKINLLSIFMEDFYNSPDAPCDWSQSGAFESKILMSSICKHSEELESYKCTTSLPAVQSEDVIRHRNAQNLAKRSKNAEKKEQERARKRLAARDREKGNYVPEIYDDPKGILGRKITKTRNPKYLDAVIPQGHPHAADSENNRPDMKRKQDKLKESNAEKEKEKRREDGVFLDKLLEGKSAQVVSIEMQKLKEEKERMERRRELEKALELEKKDKEKRKEEEELRKRREELKMKAKNKEKFPNFTVKKESEDTDKNKNQADKNLEKSTEQVAKLNLDSIGKYDKQKSRKDDYHYEGKPSQKESARSRSGESRREDYYYETEKSSHDKDRKSKSSSRRSRSRSRDRAKSKSDRRSRTRSRSRDHDRTRSSKRSRSRSRERNTTRRRSRSRSQDSKKPRSGKRSRSRERSRDRGKSNQESDKPRTSRRSRSRSQDSMKSRPSKRSRDYKDCGKSKSTKHDSSESQESRKIDDTSREKSQETDLKKTTKDVEKEIEVFSAQLQALAELEKETPGHLTYPGVPELPVHPYPQVPSYPPGYPPITGMQYPTHHATHNIPNAPALHPGPMTASYRPLLPPGTISGVNQNATTSMANPLGTSNQMNEPPGTVASVDVSLPPARPIIYAKQRVIGQPAHFENPNPEENLSLKPSNELPVPQKTIPLSTSNADISDLVSAARKYDDMLDGTPHKITSRLPPKDPVQNFSRDAEAENPELIRLKYTYSDFQEPQKKSNADEGPKKIPNQYLDLPGSYSDDEHLTMAHIGGENVLNLPLNSDKKPLLPLLPPEDFVEQDDDDLMLEFQKSKAPLLDMSKTTLGKVVEDKGRSRSGKRRDRRREMRSRSRERARERERSPIPDPYGIATGYKYRPDSPEIERRVSQKSSNSKSTNQPKQPKQPKPPKTQEQLAKKKQDRLERKERLKNDPELAKSLGEMTRQQRKLEAVKLQNREHDRLNNAYEAVRRQEMRNKVRDEERRARNVERVEREREERVRRAKERDRERDRQKSGRSSASERSEETNRDEHQDDDVSAWYRKNNESVDTSYLGKGYGRKE